MSRLLVEACVKGRWIQTGQPLQPGDLAGSLSDNQVGRRDVYTFQNLGEYALISRSTAGADYETGPGGRERVLLTDGLTVVKELRTGQSYERLFATDRRLRLRVRFTMQP